MATKRLLSLALALLLAISLPLSVAAQEYDLVNGDITVSADDSGQYVSQGDTQNELQTSDTVISSSSTTDNTITISTSEGAEISPSRIWMCRPMAKPPSMWAAAMPPST